MSFYPIRQLLDKVKKEYNIPQYSIDIFRNSENYFSYQKGTPFIKNIFYKNSKYSVANPKMVICLSLIMLCVSEKISLEDNISKHVTDFPSDKKINDLIYEYMETYEIKSEPKCFEIISEIVQKLLGCSLDKYTESYIFKPMRMHSTLFDSQTLETTACDYLKLCNNICNQGVYLSKNKNLHKSINVLCEFINKFQKQYFSYVDKNGIYTLIDINKKIIAIYNQSPSSIFKTQIGVFEELETLIYECLENETFPRGYNLFP